MDLQWSPRRIDHLLVWSQDIVLYQVVDLEKACSNESGHFNIRISDSKATEFLAKITDFPYSKIVEPYPGEGADDLVAIGLGNGKIVLTSFSDQSAPREIVPRHTRPVLSLQFNKLQPSLLAGGFDKTRADSAVAVWDMSTIWNKGSFSSGSSSNSINMDESSPLVELALGETAHSITWTLPKSLLVGMNGKQLKLFDLRDSQSKISNTTATKGVYGLSIDPLCTHHVVSYAENQAFVWDLRNFEKPFVVLNHTKPLAKVGWCPTRSGMLACLERDTNYLTLHDVHHATLSEEGDPAVLERRLYPAYSNEMGVSHFSHIASFAWHYSEENLLTTCTSSGNVLWNSTVHERITLNWSSRPTFGWSNDKKMILYIDNTDKTYEALDDISVKMKYRAENGYGLRTPLKDNMVLVEEDEMVKNVWSWLDYCKSLTEKDKYLVPSIGTLKFPGARVALRIDNAVGAAAGTLKSEIVNNSSFELHNITTYRSEERTFVQQLCGWNQEIQEPTRKAAIVLFHLKLRQSIKILNESNHSIVAMAIAGYSNDNASLWRELAQTNCDHLNDPYIRAIFSFLTDTEGGYETILNDPRISLADRLGFACSFLPDGRLVKFVSAMTVELEKSGDLSGILLTGMTPQVVPLLQKYINVTSDVQTVALLTTRTMAQEISNISLLKLWTELYRELLDSWKLWERRAEFDIVKNTNNPALVPQSEVSVSCNFCGKSISSTSTATAQLTRSSQLFNRFTSANAKPKSSCCPSCRKPLPRCSICLMHMGTFLGGSKDPQHSIVSNEAVTSWFSWCQSCRHGGHSVHLQLWFESQQECPISGCLCRCNALDKSKTFEKSAEVLDPS